MCEIRSYSSTMTTKGQLTVPKEIRDRLRLHTGTPVQFLVDSSTGEVTFERRGVECKICHGSGEVEDNWCFACGGDGVELSFRSVGEAILKAHLYGVQGSILWTDKYKERIAPLVGRPFPLVRLESERFSRQILDAYQDILQFEAIAECANEYVGTPVVLDALITSEAKSLYCHRYPYAVPAGSDAGENAERR